MLDLLQFIKKEDNLKELFIKNYKKNDCIILYGAGDALQYYLEFFEKNNIKIMCIVDKDKRKINKESNQIPIISVVQCKKEILKGNYKIVITTPRYISEIKQYLIGEGIEENNIYFLKWNYMLCF